MESVGTDYAGQLRHLAQAVQAAASGDLAVLARPVGDAPVPPELEELARALNALVERVEARLAELDARAAATRRALDRLTTAVGRATDRSAIIDTMVQAAAAAFEAEAAVFYGLSGSGELSVRATAGPAAPPIETLPPLAEGEGLAGQVVKEGGRACWPGPVAPAPAEPASGAASALAVAVRLGNRPFGVVGVYGRTDGRRFEEEDAAILQTLVHQAETAMDNAWFYEEARRLSLTDGLTGVWNRRHFELRMTEECQRAVRFGEPFGVVLLDVDHFKRVNDSWGHQAGDAVLVELARRLDLATREVDVLARYGGEEFALILPKTDVEGAFTLASKVRESVAAEPFSFDSGSIQVTISAGTAACPEHGITVSALVGAADEALYRAKGSGRNRVERARGPEHET